MSLDKPWLKHYPEGIPHTVDCPNIPVGDLLTNSAKEYPDKSALLLDGKNFIKSQMTFKELNQHALNFAKNLYQLGIRRNDRVILFVPNFPEFQIAFFGIQKLGAIAVPLNVLYSSHELEYFCKDSGAKVIITIDVKTKDPSILEVVHETVAKVPTVEKVIVVEISKYIGKFKGFLGKLVGKITKLYPNDISFESMLNEIDISLPEITIDPMNDIAVIPYTGGTTGLSKGVMLTHYNLVSNCVIGQHWMIPTYNGLPPKGKLKILGALPLFHLFGFTVAMLLGAYLACEVILIPNPRERDFTEMLELIDMYQPDMFPFVPTGYIALLNHPDIKNYNLKSIDFCISAAAPLPLEVMKQFKELSGTTIIEGYGLTETSPLSSGNSVIKPKVGSVGMPVIDVDMRIFDPDDKNKRIDTIGEQGEIGIKGPNIMQGYWQKPEETNHVMNNDGYFLSGDIGYMDDEGYFYITDRKKDMIITSGYKIFPREVEEVFFEHSDIENVAIVGVPDKYRGESPKAYIVLKQGSTATEEDIMAYAKEKLGKYKVPKEIVFRDELPVSAVGKVLRRTLRDENL